MCAHEPLTLTFVQGMSDVELRDLIASQLPYYRGEVILPAGCEVQVIQLQSQRIEPDIEDELGADQSSRKACARIRCTHED